MELSLHKMIQGVGCQTVAPHPSERRPAGPVYAFVPANAGANAAEMAREVSRGMAEQSGRSVLVADFYARGFPLWGTPEAPQRLDGQTWGAFVTHGEWFDTLEAREAHPREIRRLLEHARDRYGVTCADLTGAKEVVALEALRQADSIFVVSTSDGPSLNLAHYKAEWLRSIDVEQKCGLLLHRVPGGASPQEAEEITGLPVCAVVDGPQDLQHLAGWLGSVREGDQAVLGAA